MQWHVATHTCSTRMRAIADVFLPSATKSTSACDQTCTLLTHWSMCRCCRRQPSDRVEHSTRKGLRSPKENGWTSTKYRFSLSAAASARWSLCQQWVSCSTRFADCDVESDVRWARGNQTLRSRMPNLSSPTCLVVVHVGSGLSVHVGSRSRSQCL